MNSRPRKKTSILKMNFIVLKFVFKFCPGLVVFALFNVIASVVVAVSEVNIIAKAINIVMETYDLDLLFNSIVSYVIVILVCYIFKIFYNRFITVRYRVIYRKKMQTYLFNKVKHIDMASYDNPNFYDRYSRALNDSSWRGIAVFNNFVDFIQASATAIALGAYIMITNIFLISIVLVSAIVNVIVVNITNKTWYKIYRDSENDRRYSFYVRRTFYQQKFAAEIKTTSIGDLLIDKYDEKVYNIENIYHKGEKKLLGVNSIYYFSHNLIEQAASYIYLAYKLLNGMSVALFTSTINAVFKFSNSFVRAISIYTNLREHSYYISDFLWIVNYNPSVETNNGIEINEDFKELDIKDISFSYPGNDYNSINHLSMNIKKGEKIAIVGDNSGGKTTLMKLLLKFYNPKEGSILYNGIDLKDYNEISLRKQYSIVFQDFQIYAITIAENVLMHKVRGKEDEDKVKMALEKVGLLEKILKMKDGIYTQVTREFDQDGANFSGGERQRLVISRVFASDANIYILDEPTSSLDPLSEERINKLIIQNVTNKTMIIIAHRLSTVVDADKIYLIKKGQIYESGNHSELMDKHGYYYEMFSTQKSLYEKQD